MKEKEKKKKEKKKGRKENASKAKAEYAEIQSIANSILFVMVEPLYRGYEVKGQGSCQAKK